jgi:cobalamin synthase
LLDACASATEARESINSLKDSTIGRFAWFVLTLITFVFCLTIILYTPSVWTARLISLLVVFSLLATVQLVYEYDRGNSLRHRFIAELYLENMKKAKAPLATGRA